MGVIIFLGIMAIFIAGSTLKALGEMGPLAYAVLIGISAVFILGLTFMYLCKRNKYMEEANKQMEQVKQQQEKVDKDKQEVEKLIENQKAYSEAQKRELEQLEETNKQASEAQKRELEQLEETHKQAVEQLEANKKALIQELADLDKRIEYANSELTVAEATVFEDENITSEEYKDKLALLRLEYKDFMKSDEAVIETDFTIYVGEKKKRLNDNIRQILRCFNSEAAYIVSSATATNIEKMRGALSKAFETINSIFSTDGLALNKQLLELRLKELNYVYSYQKKKEQEQEEQKAIRAQMLEEEKVRREIEREKAKVAKEESQFKNEVDKLMKYLSKASDDVQKQLYVDKIKELEEKIKLLEKDKENILEREQNTRAGFVYIISNIGSFGEDVYKIGMTRRLEPMDRVKELGDASVPFEFDVHAMIFSEDAPALETILHNTFKAHQVNLVNPRKEFYNVSLSEIEKVIKENYNATVTFTHIAEAAQYRESVKIRSKLTEA